MRYFNWSLISFGWFAAWVGICAPVAAAPWDVQFFGDTYLPESLLSGKRRGTVPGINPFVEVAPLLAESRENVVNFEAVATKAFYSPEPKWHLLRASLAMPGLLAQHRITGAGLANNHAMDFGFQGLFDSISLLEKAGIRIGGAGIDIDEALRPMIFQTPSYTYCVFSVSRTYPMSFWATTHRPGTGTVSLAEASGLLARFPGCNGSMSISIVFIHWGQELSREVQAYQRLLAKSFIDSGAMLVIGHHPHILQEVEQYRDRYIFYSIGNFAFGSLTATGRQEGAAIAVRVQRNNLGTQETDLAGDPNRLSVRITPLAVDNRIVHYKPRTLPRNQPLPVNPLTEFVNGAIRNKSCVVDNAASNFHSFVCK